MHGWLPWHQLGGAPELGQRGPGLVEREQARAREQVCGAERRIETGRGAELDERIRMLSTPLEDDAEVVPDEGAIAAGQDDGAEGGLSRLEAARRQRRDAFVEPHGLCRRQVLRDRPGQRRHEQDHCQRRPEQGPPRAQNSKRAASCIVRGSVTDPFHLPKSGLARSLVNANPPH